MDTRITQAEWMDKEATTNDNDAIEADMHAHAGDADFILRATQRQSAVMMVVATVYDTDCLQTVKQTHGCSLWSSGSRWCHWCRCFLDTKWACPRRRCCGRLPVAPSRALRPRHLASEAPRLCLVETVLPSPEDVLLLREAHAAPPRSNR